MEFVYLVFTRMRSKSDCRRLGFLLLCLCDVFRALINALVLLVVVDYLSVSTSISLQYRN